MAVIRIGKKYVMANGKTYTFYFTAKKWVELEKQMEVWISNNSSSSGPLVNSEPIPKTKEQAAQVILKPYIGTHTFPPKNGQYIVDGQTFGGEKEDKTPAKPSYIPILDQLAMQKTNCTWNLPPHAWSYPISPSAGKNYSTGMSANTDPNRRGKIYFFYTDPETTNVSLSEDPNDPSKTTFVNTSPTEGDPRKYGFQFVWNPEMYGTQVGLQEQMTPSPGDVFVGGLGMFPGMSSLQFTIRIDRTNDFACFKRMKDPIPVSEMINYYPSEVPGEYSRWYDKLQPQTTKLDWLLNFGTIADIEYLYRCMTDVNVISKELNPSISKKVNEANAEAADENTSKFITADIGYLPFSLVALELGPTYYIGYLTSISVNHLMFTEEYVPIRSDVSLSMNVMANGTTTAAILGNSPETSTTTETPDGTRITNPDGSSAMGTVPGDVTSSQTNVVLGWPLPGVGYPTSKAAKVGCRTHPVTGKKSCHTGIDISAPSGTPIRCAAKGKVIKRVTTDSVWGKHVWVEHSKGFVTKYNHMSEISVSLNQSVDAGAILGEVGETGLATGPHLHFEVAINGEAWDPLSWFGYPAQKVGCAKTGCV